MKPPRQVVIGVDLDGVCADFYARIREIAALLLVDKARRRLAAQIEDPRDIQRPRAMTPADAGRRTVVFDLYRTGKPTSAEREELIRDTAVSRAVN